MNKINDSSDTSFDEYFESTAEHDMLLALHRTVPPALVILNCVGSASTLAVTSRPRGQCEDPEVVLSSAIRLVL